MKVYKFGGASIKNAEGIKNVAEILKNYSQTPLVVVVSALGKTTNALEAITRSFFNKNEDLENLVLELKKTHHKIIDGLFNKKNGKGTKQVINSLIGEMEGIFEEPTPEYFNFLYDQIVSKGELLSSKIIYHYLKNEGVNVEWLDVRHFIKTNNDYREAKVNYEKTYDKIRHFKEKMMKNDSIYITQGFLGATPENLTTTLGREGSDYTAAIFGHCLDAESVTIWKDVEGILSADPRKFKNPQLLSELTYNEAIEMSYYGATVIHPKTIKPLQNKGIKLCVRSFIDTKKEGTIISKSIQTKKLPPLIASKNKQLLIKISTKDFSFISGETWSKLMEIFTHHNVKINLSQNSAIGFTVCVNENKRKIPQFLQELKLRFEVEITKDVELITVRHYDKKICESLIENKTVLLSQKEENVVHWVVSL